MTSQQGMSYEEARETLHAGVGLVVHEPRLGFGTFVTFRLRPSDGAPGQEWYFWVYQCAWRLDVGSEAVIGSEDRREQMAATVTALDGARLESVDLSATQDLVLTFSGDRRLRLFRSNTQDDEQWMVWRPDGRVLIAAPQGWLDEPANARLAGSGADDSPAP